MTSVKRATESQSDTTEWQLVPTGLWRWMVAENPTVGPSGFLRKDGTETLNVKFQLMLTENEKARLLEEYGPPPDGMMQSWRAYYTCGLSLGYFKDGQYISTKLIDFLGACLGSEGNKAFHKWIAAGNGPNEVEGWLAWWKELEVYGTIEHKPDKKEPGKMWAYFAGPMPVGSLPGQKEPEYQALGRGKFKAMVQDCEAEVYPADHPAAGTAVEQEPAPDDEGAQGARSPARTYEETFPEDVLDTTPPARPTVLSEYEAVCAEAATYGIKPPLAVLSVTPDARIIGATKALRAMIAEADSVPF